MADTIELSDIDLRYEHLRIKDSVREYSLQSSIMEQGILEPLCILVLSDTVHVLLDGYKRYRCAVRLRLLNIPTITWEYDAAVGILKLLKFSSGNRLTAIEEAGLVNELHLVHKLSLVEIGGRLERSVSWVSLRLGLMQEMSADVREKIFSGQFPVRSYMYSLRHFTRVKSSVSKAMVSTFVGCVSGKGLSGRDIDRLAHAYFKGGAIMKSQIEAGQLDWTLRQLKERDNKQAVSHDTTGDAEKCVLSQLETIHVNVIKLSSGLKNTCLTRECFLNRALKKVLNLLKSYEDFNHTLREFYDSTNAKRDCCNAVSAGKAQESDCQAA